MKKNYKTRLFEQKLLGLAVLIVSLIIFYAASTSMAAGDSDATALLLVAPFGLYLLFTHKVIIY